MFRRAEARQRLQSKADLAGGHGGCGGCRRGLVCCGGVLGGALSLELGGVEDTVVAVGAYREGLGVVLEGIGRGFGALIADLKGTALLK